MRLIVRGRDFPFRDVRLHRVVDLVVLAVLSVFLTTRVVKAVRATDPTPAPLPVTDGPTSHQIVLVLHVDGRWTLDGQLVPRHLLVAELDRMFARRAAKVLFITNAGGRSNPDVMAATAAAYAAGITTVGYLSALDR